MSLILDRFSNCWKKSGMLEDSLWPCSNSVSVVSSTYLWSKQSTCRYTNKYKKLTNRAMPICKVVEVLQDFLSEYVDKKFTRHDSVILYLSIFNSFRVIWCLSQCVSLKISIFTTLLFTLGTPLWQSRKMLHEWKDNSVLAEPLTACTHLSSTVSQLFEPQVQKIAVFTYYSPHFCFPWRCPCDHHAII